MEWPAAMRFETAKAYLDLESKSHAYTVLNQIPPVEFTERGERRWLRADLDAFLEKLRNRAVSSPKCGPKDEEPSAKTAGGW